MSLSGKLDEGGVLYIERHGRLKEQFCPTGKFKNCCDYCPRLGEPCWNDTLGTVDIVICGSFLVRFSKFADERQEPNKEQRKSRKKSDS